MAEEQQTLQSDVLAPDDLVILLDGTVTSVVQSIRSPDPLHVFNYRLFSLRPADLDDRTRIREKINGAISTIEAGAFDAMFTRAAAVQGSGTSGNVTEARALRDCSLSRLRHLLIDDHALAAISDEGKKAVQYLRAKGIHPTEDSALAKANAYLGANNSPVTRSFDRIFTAERMPIVLFDDHNESAHRAFPDYDGYLHPSDAGYICLNTDALSGNQKHRDLSSLVSTHILFDQLLSKRLGIMRAHEVEHLPGSDFGKMKYYLGRKRTELASYNRTAPRQIQMFPDELTAARSRANLKDPYDAQAISFHGPGDNLAEVHHLLTYYTDAAEQAKVRGRFDHVVAFHEAALAALDQKIEQHLQASKLPPQLVAEIPVADIRTPHTPETILPIVETMIARYRQKLPEADAGYDPRPVQFRCKLELTEGFPILFELMDMQGEHLEQMRVRTNAQFMDRGNDLKKTVQNHILHQQHVYPYRNMRGANYGTYDREAIIPTVPPNGPNPEPLQIGGMWRLNLYFDEAGRKVELPVNLGLEQTRPIADTRARRDWVMNRLQDARKANETMTWGQLWDEVQMHFHQLWEMPNTRIAQSVPDTVTTIPQTVDNGATTLAFQTPGTVLRIKRMRLERSPTPSWVMPVEIYPWTGEWKGRTVQLCTADEHEADRRALEFVKSVVKAENRLATNHPGSTWDTYPHEAVLRPIEREAHTAHAKQRVAGVPTVLTDHDRWEFIRLATPIFELDHAAVLASSKVLDDKHVSFTIAGIRGAARGSNEPVMEQIRQPLLRNITIPANLQHRIPDFVEAVDKELKRDIHEAFGRRTDQAYDPARIVKEKAKGNYNTTRIVDALDEAIRIVRRQDHDFQQFQPVNPGYGGRGGGHGRGRG